jgi:anaerobic ribonucleoside-triphosphate reductase activating protein
VGACLERSRANGPGERFVVWTQGCALACPGCFNPPLWDRAPGESLEVSALARRINAVGGLRGVTVSGGEPLEQPEALAALLDLLRKDLDSAIFTGFSPAEIAADPARARILKLADLVVAGRYVREQASDANPWAGSSNKEILELTGRIRRDEFPSCRVEVRIAADGVVSMTGFPPQGFKAAMSR